MLTSIEKYMFDEKVKPKITSTTAREFHVGANLVFLILYYVSSQLYYIYKRKEISKFNILEHL